MSTISDVWTMTERVCVKSEEKEVAYMLAAPLPPAPRQPMRSMDRGVRQRRKPARPLFTGKCQPVSSRQGNVQVSIRSGSCNDHNCCGSGRQGSTAGRPHQW